MEFFAGDAGVLDGVGDVFVTELALDGEIDHRDVFLSEHEKQENKRICACVSRVVGRITLDTAWRPETVS